MSENTPSFENASVSAILAKRSREDRNELLADLVTMLSGIVPGSQVDRTLFKREVKALRLPLDGHLYCLQKNSHGSFDATRQQVVRGVTVRTTPLELDAFIEELGLALDAELQRTDRGRDALRQWMNSSNS